MLYCNWTSVSNQFIMFVPQSAEAERLKEERLAAYAEKKAGSMYELRYNFEGVFLYMFQQRRLL